MGTANFGPLTNPSGPKAGRMRIREGELPACRIQLKKQTNRENEERRGGQNEELCSKFLAVVPLFLYL